MLIFDLAVVAKALAQFEHSSEVLVFNIDASIETTAQFKQAMEAGVSLEVRQLQDTMRRLITKVARVAQ